MRTMQIVVQAGEREVGSIIADLLDRKGVKIEAVTVVERLPAAVNRPAGGRGTTSVAEIIKLLKKGRPVGLKALQEKMVETGYSKMTFYPTLTKFIKEGLVLKDEENGSWCATKKGLDTWQS